MHRSLVEPHFELVARTIVYIRPVAFRIRNYKSIADSGICTLSGDRITVLAGQNEAGKTSILRALDDFNDAPGAVPQLEDVVPDHNTGAIPYVAIKFQFLLDELLEDIKEDSKFLSQAVIFALKAGFVWVERDLISGKFEVQGDAGVAFRKQSESESPDEVQQHKSGSIGAETDGVQPEFVLCDEGSFLDSLYNLWPFFDYFDSFDDLLPRKVKIDLVSKTVSGVTKEEEPEIPSAVKNFLTVSGITLAKVRKLADLDDDEKQLKNYLSERSSVISGEFLDYWKQRNGDVQTVKLLAEFSRRKDGSYLAFYVNDGRTLQFPAQRSKGFVWFLSFYLRLAASVAPKKGRLPRFILIDEPGSFLHPKAQHDILDILQRRIVNEDDIVVYSTHSPYLLPADKLHRVRLVMKQHGSSIVADRLNDERVRQDIRGDALAPIMNAIGIEVGSQMSALQGPSIIVEGITDYYYLHAFEKVLCGDFLKGKAILIAKGTPNIPYSVSLAIAHGTNFVVLLDRDNAGNAAAEKLIREMNITPASVVQMHDSMGIEDVFSAQDFRMLMTNFDCHLKIEANQRPCAAIKKLGVDKVLLARKFAELVNDAIISRGSLTEKTLSAATALFEELQKGVSIDPIYRID